MARLATEYREKIVPALMEEFSYQSVMQVPRIEKITLNIGLGEAVGDKKIMENATSDLAAISGQKPVVTVARKSIAGFKIRDGYPIGTNSSKAFDGRGNYSLGIKEQIIFPEIDYDKIDAMRGMNITVTTSARSDAEALSLLKKFNFPFRQ